MRDRLKNLLGKINWLNKVRAFFAANPRRAKFIGIVAIALFLPLVVAAALTVQNLQQKASAFPGSLEILDKKGNNITGGETSDTSILLKINLPSGWVAFAPPSVGFKSDNSFIKKAYAVINGQSATPSPTPRPTVTPAPTDSPATLRELETTCLTKCSNEDTVGEGFDGSETLSRCNDNCVKNASAPILPIYTPAPTLTPVPTVSTPQISGCVPAVPTMSISAWNEMSKFEQCKKQMLMQSPYCDKQPTEDKNLNQFNRTVNQACSVFSENPSDITVNEIQIKEDDGEWKSEVGEKVKSSMTWELKKLEQNQMQAGRSISIMLVGTRNSNNKTGVKEVVPLPTVWVTLISSGTPRATESLTDKDATCIASCYDIKNSARYTRQSCETQVCAGFDYNKQRYLTDIKNRMFGDVGGGAVDINFPDGIISSTDTAIVVGLVGKASAKDYPQADLNNDGKIDQQDYNSILKYVGVVNALKK